MTDLIIWSEKYSVGCNYIDEQHKKLIEIINRLNEAYMHKGTQQQLKAILDELVDYTKFHFEAEEKMLAEHNFGPSEEHKQQHQEFVEKIEIFRKRLELSDDLLSFDMMTYLKEWLLNHILGTDMKYSEAVCSKVD